MRGWRMCISGCPYKKIYFNWKSGKSEKCIFCYPRIESGQPTVCSETCVGRIRYLGVLLYDADRIEEAASTEHETDLYERQCDVFLDPHDPAVIEEAFKQGIPQNVIDAAQLPRFTRWRWTGSWPCRCIRNTAPCRWSGTFRRCHRSSLTQMRAACRSTTACYRRSKACAYRCSICQHAQRGRSCSGAARLNDMMAMRHYKRSQTVEGVTDTRAIEEVGLSVEQVEEMYRYLAIANYEDRFVIPTSHREMARDASRNATAAASPLATGATVPTPNSTSLTAAALMPSTSPKCATTGRESDADPQNHRPAD